MWELVLCVPTLGMRNFSHLTTREVHWQASGELWGEGVWSCQRDDYHQCSVINAGTCPSILSSIDGRSCLANGEMNEPP